MTNEIIQVRMSMVEKDTVHIAGLPSGGIVGKWPLLMTSKKILQEADYLFGVHQNYLIKDR